MLSFLLLTRETTVIHSPGATFVGSDRVGNKYYERMSEQFGELLTELSMLAHLCGYYVGSLFAPPSFSNDVTALQGVTAGLFMAT